MTVTGETAAMTTEHPVTVTGITAEQRWFPTVEDMTIAYHPGWEYLRNHTLPVRPPTDEEAAQYEARKADPSWADLYAPALPPRPAVPHVDLLGAAEAVPGPASAEPQAPALPEYQEAALERFNQLHDDQPADEPDLT